jgi:integrase
MASLYEKPPSEFWWIRYRDLSVEPPKPPKWRGKSTGYKIDGLRGDQKAEELRQITDQQEKLFNAKWASILDKPSRTTHPWDEWDYPLMHSIWGNRSTSTLDINTYAWKSLRRFFAEKGITHPGLVDGDVIRAYIPWRKATGAGANSAIKEIRLLAVMLDYAYEEKNWIPSNPARTKWLERELSNLREPERHAIPWSDHQVDTVREALKDDWYGYMNMSFHVALFQGVRHSQVQIPLENIYLPTHIFYPGEITRNGQTFHLVKRVRGKKHWGYSQPILKPFVPILTDFVEHRKSLGEERLIDLPRWSKRTVCQREYGPGRASHYWRVFLDQLNFPEISFHGLRARWITLAREGGVDKALTKAFVNHTSDRIHDQYTHAPEYDVAALNAVARTIAHI